MKEPVKRALRTFLEAALGYASANMALALGGENINVSKAAVLALISSAVAAGIAAVLNMPKKS